MHKISQHIPSFATSSTNETGSLADGLKDAEGAAGLGLDSVGGIEKAFAKLKYRAPDKDGTYDKWRLQSPRQLFERGSGICYDTASAADVLLNDLGVEHSNYFSYPKDGSPYDPTHTFNVYKDENGEWRWLEGSWADFKGNKWHERSKKKLVRNIVKALSNSSGKKQKVVKVDRFPEPGTSMPDFYDFMISKQASRPERIENGTGTVLAVLPDQTGDFTHQRLLIYDRNKKKVVISNNVDIGRRIDVKPGDRIRFAGEPKGNVVHWTHLPYGYVEKAASCLNR